VWAAVYPHGTASHTAPGHLVNGGLRRPTAAALGFDLSVQLPADKVFELLRSDAGWLRQACTAEQAEAMGAATRRTDTVWTDTDEGRQELRREREQALARYREMWGRDPA
jgi:hypothetical protein